MTWTVLFSFVLFLGIVIGFTVIGLRFWVKPKRSNRSRYRRRHSTRTSSRRIPACVFRDMIERLGEILPE